MNPTNNPTEELREKLDEIFAKLQVAGVDEDGQTIYHESRPFVSQLTEAVELFHQEATKQTIKELEDAIKGAPVSGYTKQIQARANKLKGDS